MPYNHVAAPAHRANPLGAGWPGPQAPLHDMGYGLGADPLASSKASDFARDPYARSLHLVRLESVRLHLRFAMPFTWCLTPRRTKSRTTPCTLTRSGAFCLVFQH